MLNYKVYHTKKIFLCNEFFTYSTTYLFEYLPPTYPDVYVELNLLRYNIYVFKALGFAYLNKFEYKLVAASNCCILTEFLFLYAACSDFMSLF